DFLVHSLRTWLTSKQKETRRGRTELLLADLAAAWNTRPDRRHLPSLPQWTAIRLLTQKKTWNEPQSMMMAKAAKLHAFRGLIVAASLALLCFFGWDGYGRMKASSLRDQLLNANTADVPVIVEEMDSYRRWVNPLLRNAYDNAKKDNDPRKQLHASLALLPVDPSQVNYLADRLLEAQPHEVPLLCDALLPNKQELLEKLWSAAERSVNGKEQQRLRAACALASYDPDSRRWIAVQDQIASDLVGVPPVYLSVWIDSLRPVGLKLQIPLAGVFRDANRRETERSLATDILADYAAAQPRFLANLLMDADQNQFVVLFAKLSVHGDEGMTSLEAELDKELRLVTDEDAKEKLAKRQANAAVALLKMGRQARVWPLLKHLPDPRIRSYLLHRLGPLGADVRTIVEQLDQQADVTIKRALVLSFGEFSAKDWPPGARDSVLQKLQNMYQTTEDSGLRAAAEWVLRQWKQDLWIKRQDDDWMNDRRELEKKLERIRQELTDVGAQASPLWYVNGQGQTMVVFPGPVAFFMGSPSTEAGHFENELFHRQSIGRSFAIAAKPVTVEQFLRFFKDYRKDKRFVSKYAPTDDCPVHGATWYLAAEYCNWLSKQEGLPEKEWCYEPSKDGRYEDGMSLAPNYLKRSGYRLPTEAEWEYACRAKATTSRYYGESDELLGKYGWFVGNSSSRGSGSCTWPVGSLKPNDFGLFDVHGNVWCWCQERYKDYAPDEGGNITEDLEDILTVNSHEHRVMRGGSFDFIPVDLRSANRHRNVPTDHDFNFGLRPARTHR
ncbi:MAG: formylglycine-generating enzyme family protein, partial [Gemmataceae bacterium]